MRQFSNSYFCDIVWNSLRIFTNQSTWMCSNRVEVTKFSSPLKNNLKKQIKFCPAKII
uniref:Candidate secreted effector n=1 Tax=Meloidogyne incognita TaxID=6306 RepID=A0A914LZ75_MELIC